MKGFLCATHWQENLSMMFQDWTTSCLSQVKFPDRLLPLCFAGLGKHQKHRADQAMSWKPRGYRSREQSGRTLGETTASAVVMQRQKGPERSCCVLQERGGSLAGRRQWGCSCHWLQYVEWLLTSLLALSTLLCLTLFRMSTLTEVTFRH